jgi:hypothetical protein
MVFYVLGPKINYFAVTGYVTTTALGQMFCSVRCCSREGMASQNDTDALVSTDNPMN